MTKWTPFFLLAILFASSLLVRAEEDAEEEAEEKKGKSDVGTVIGIDLGTTYSW